MKTKDSTIRQTPVEIMMMIIIVINDNLTFIYRLWAY